jgi:hypothetical protein
MCPNLRNPLKKKRKLPMKSKYIYAGAAVLGVIAVGTAMGGSAPATATVKCGCHGYSLVPEATSGCHGQLLQPVYQEEKCGCHGRRGGITLAERRVARQAARANYDKTFAAFLDAADKGELRDATSGPELTTMKMVAN